MNTHDKYWWVYDHPEYNSGKRSVAEVEITPHMVNPINNTIEKDKSLNTKLQWWIEVMYEDYIEDGDPHEYGYHSVHDWEVDTGGDSIDEAIDNLYEEVKARYGEY